MQFLQIQHIPSLLNLLHMCYEHVQPYHTSFEDLFLKRQWMLFCLRKMSKL